MVVVADAVVSEVVGFVVWFSGVVNLVVSTVLV